MKVIELIQIQKKFSDSKKDSTSHILKNLSFSIERGTTVGFLGANGAGKTTTFKIIFDLVRPDSGQVFYFGKPQLSSEVKLRMGFLPERPFYYEFMTGEEFLKLFLKLQTANTKKINHDTQSIEQVLKLMDLWHAKDKPLRNYSKGMLQRIGIARAIVHQPELLIMDEPMSGLDPDGRALVKDLIQQQAKKGTTILFSSHQLNDVEKLCQQLLVLDHGSLIFSGSVQNLIESHAAKPPAPVDLESAFLQLLHTSRLASIQGTKHV